MTWWQQSAIELYKSGLGSVKIAEELGRSHGSVKLLVQMEKSQWHGSGWRKRKRRKASISDHGEYYIVRQN